MLGVVKRTPKSLRPTHIYPKMPVVGNLPRNVNILETFDDNELLKKVSSLGFGGYPYSKLTFDYILFINQLGKKLQLFLHPVWFSFTFACLTISHNYSTLLIKRRFIYISYEKHTCKRLTISRGQF